MNPPRTLSAESWRRLSALFDELSEASEAARAGRLEELARTEPDLATALARLLSADSAGDELLDTPLGIRSSVPEGAGADDPMPERAGCYRLVERLGRGGMATVYAGERDDGLFEQRVAVKVLRRGLDTHDVLARFERERHILARLEHPAIARLLDAGALEDGRPYLILERVDGQPIQRYADEAALALEARLRLVLTACDAVAYAHGRLIVHRDLKPSNVLISSDGKLKLLDFGIAKLLEPEPGSPATAREVRLLTPAYAAPEQLAGEPTTTATDVWGLGALAYELLVGEPPSARRAPDEPPPRASAVVLVRDGGTHEGRRRAARLIGDLDVILKRALALEPERRYPSAEALGVDIQRHLAGQPITARADSVSYRAGKFVRRHRVGVAAAALTTIALVAGVAVASWQAGVARRERAAAERARDRNEALVEFMLGDLQQELEPTHRLDVVLRLTDAVLRSLDEIPADERDAVAQAQRARVLFLAASVRRNQGDTERAVRELEEAIAILSALPDGPRVGLRLATSYGILALVLEDRGDLDASIAAAREGVERWRVVRTANPDVESRVGLADALNQLGRGLLVAGKTSDALASHRAAIAEVSGLGADARATRDVAITLYDGHLYVGRGLEFSGDLEGAAEEFRVAIEQATAFSVAHPDDRAALHQVSVVTNDRGRVLKKQGRYPEARAEYESALRVVRRVVERDPGNLMYLADLSASHAFLGRVAELEGDLPKALAHHRDDVVVNQDLVAKEPGNGLFRRYLAAALGNEGRVLARLDRLDEALDRHQRSQVLRERALEQTPDDVVAQADVGEGLLERGRVLARLGQRETARSEWRRAVGLLERALERSDYGPHRVRYARTLLELGEVERARPVVERLLAERGTEPELLELWKPVAAGSAIPRTPR